MFGMLGTSTPVMPSVYPRWSPDHETASDIEEGAIPDIAIVVHSTVDSIRTHDDLVLPVNIPHGNPLAPRTVDLCALFQAAVFASDRGISSIKIGRLIFLSAPEGSGTL